MRIGLLQGSLQSLKKICEACLICISNNPGKACKVEALATHPPLDRPFEHIMMDFIELTPSEGKKNCLVIVDLWSKWVEAFPTAN